MCQNNPFKGSKRAHNGLFVWPVQSKKDAGYFALRLFLYYTFTVEVESVPIDVNLPFLTVYNFPYN